MTQQRDVTKTQDRDREAILFLGLLAAAVAGTGVWLAYVRLHCTMQQLVEFLSWPILAAAFGFDALRYLATGNRKRQSQWPRPSPFVSDSQTQAQLDQARTDDKVLIGHETSGAPFFWTNDMRTMQGIAFGMSGAGKTTFLQLIAEQDIARGGPLIFIDGKGDMKLFSDLLPVIQAAKRTHQLRLIDPGHPELSASYNPFWAPDGNPDDHVGFIFESFRMDRHDFFDEHQRVYLENIARVLFYSGKRFNFHDVLVAAYDESVMRRQMKIAWERAEADPNVSKQHRLTLQMSIHNLLATFQDIERVSKIQGLINHIMTFMAEDLALITGPYDDLLTLEDVVDNNLILYLSLNVNVNARAVTALGRILLQNLQLMIGRRYSSSTINTKHPFLSVIMDEFSPFAYENFSTIVQTARGANVAFLFSLQSAPQLLQVGKGFRNDLSSAPNTTFMLRVRDEETAQLFLKASAHVKQMRRSVQVRKSGVLDPEFAEQETGSQSEVLDTVAQDEHLKKMPTGQMELLMSDHTHGLLHRHVHIRRPDQCYAVAVPPSLYPNVAVPRRCSDGLYLTFPIADLEGKREEQTRKRRSNRGAR